MQAHTPQEQAGSQFGALPKVDSRHDVREAAYEQAVTLATELCQTSISFIGLMDGNLLSIKSAHGLRGVQSIALDTALCNHTLMTRTLTEVIDASCDPRSSQCELVVKAPMARLYASVPLIDKQGMAVGTLAVLDKTPRELTKEQRKSLVWLASYVSSLLKHDEVHKTSLRKILPGTGANPSSFGFVNGMTVAIDDHGMVADASDAFLRTMGYARNQMLGMEFGNLLATTSRHRFINAVLPEVQRTGKCKGVDLQFVAAQGRLHSFNFAATTQTDPFQGGSRISATLLPPRNPEQKNISAMAESNRLAVTLRAIGDAVISTDHLGHVEFLNASAEEMLGCTLDEVRGQPLDSLYRLVKEDTREGVEHSATSCLARQQTVNSPLDCLLIARNGHEVAVEDSAAPIKDYMGRLTGVVMVLKDVTNQRHLQKQAMAKVSRDAMTGMFNQSEFEARLGQVLEQFTDADAEHALCYVDLDQFSLVNESLGRAAGDELICQVAHLLAAAIRKNDVLARLGGDEFGVLLPNCPVEQAQLVADNLRRVVGDFMFTWESLTYRLSVSVGQLQIKGLASTGGDLPTQVSGLLHTAQQACLAAQARGGNCVQLHGAPIESGVRGGSGTRRVAHVPYALDEQRLQLFAQEIAPLQLVPMGSSHIEILVRLQSSNGEFIAPGEFLPAAEHYNRVSNIDRWVVSHVLSWLTSQPRFVRDVGHCSINLSGQSLSNADFQRFVVDAVDHCGLPGNKLCFEVTETAAIANVNSAAKFMTALRERGCLLALDDFGAGLSSFAYLRNLPIDILKIDGMFIRGMVNDPVDQALVRSINSMGQLLGKETVAEWVENTQTWNLLRDMGVNFAQGFTLGHPEPVDELVSRW